MYWYFALLRFGLVFLPWTGYIHPDEFFQSLEVIGGKFLNVDSKLTWEFNCTSPIRSIALQYFTLGTSYKFLISLDHISKFLLKTTLITPYFVLLIPRIFMCISSFLVDYSLFKICSNNNEPSKSRLFILSTSYVIFTYATKTFSNSFELFLFSLLLYYVSESLTFSNQIICKKKYVQYRYMKSKTIPEKAKFHKLNLFLESDSYRNVFKIATIVVVGFFNRPTFLAYSLMPIFFWLYRGIGSKVISNVDFHLRILVLLLCSLPSLLFIILVDSFYYGYISWGEIGMLDVSIDSFVFTPLNFVRYNMNPKNLEKHGLHPRYLHMLVSMPLLFNLLAIFHYYNLGFYLSRLTQSKFNLLPSVRSIKGLMTLSSVTPLILLSFFRHQEPRFMVPLLLPLVYLYGSKIAPEKETGVTRAEPNNFKVTNVKRTSNFLLILWLGINFVLIIFYGFIHQGGIVSAMSRVSNIIKTYDNSVEFRVISSHNYMLPKFLLLQPKSGNDDGSLDEGDNRVKIFEDGTKDLDSITRIIESVYNSCKRLSGKKFKIYLVIPTGLKFILNKFGRRNLVVKEIGTFFPHFSSEALPHFGEYYLDLFQLLSYDTLCDFDKSTTFLKKLIEPFGLGVYDISVMHLTQ